MNMYEGGSIAATYNQAEKLTVILIIINQI